MSTDTKNAFDVPVQVFADSPYKAATTATFEPPCTPAVGLHKLLAPRKPHATWIKESAYFDTLAKYATLPYANWDPTMLHSLTLSLQCVASPHSIREIMHVAWRTLQQADALHTSRHGIRLDATKGTFNKSRVAFRAQMLGEDFSLESPGRAVIVRPAPSLRQGSLPGSI
jgi:hypothetical protein